MLAEAPVDPETPKEWYAWLTVVVREIESLPRRRPRGGAGAAAHARRVGLAGIPGFPRPPGAVEESRGGRGGAGREAIPRGRRHAPRARPFVTNSYSPPLPATTGPATRRGAVPRAGSSTNPSTRPATLVAQRSPSTRPTARGPFASPATRPATGPAAADAGGAEVVFEPLQFAMPDAGPASGRIRSSVTFAGIVRAGEGIDVLWGGPNLYVMKEKGVVKLAWQAPDLSINFNSVSFDGRYVWAASPRHRQAEPAAGPRPGH